MTAWDDLYRAIMESPDDDTPRLYYADYLDEHPEQDSDRERAEMIRTHISRGIGPLTCPVGSAHVLSGGSGPIEVAPKIPGVQWTIHRGFPSSASLSLAAFMGQCSGTHLGIGTPECSREPHHHCDEKCKGLAKRVGEWPVESVRLTCREPMETGLSGEKSRWVWLHRSTETDFQYDFSSLPSRLFDRLSKRSNGISQYRTKEKAHAALSLAAVNYARSLNGYNPLPYSGGCRDEKTTAVVMSVTNRRLYNERREGRR